MEIKYNMTKCRQVEFGVTPPDGFICPIVANDHDVLTMRGRELVDGVTTVPESLNCTQCGSEPVLLAHQREVIVQQRSR